VYVRFRFIFVEDILLCYLFAVKHDRILLFKLLATSFGHYTITVARGGVVVKALHYKPAGRGFDS